MHAYTIGAIVALVIAVGIDLWVTKSKVVFTAQFWIAVVIVLGFQVFVDGWLTKLSAPIVEYAPNHFSGIRVFFSSPIEDFIYGLSIITLTLTLWVRTR
ncbi:MAG: lycopene cyclase domain-containing protein [Acidimicrobiales bacterium]